MKNETKATFKMYLMFASWYLASNAVAMMLDVPLKMRLIKVISPAELGTLMAVVGIPWVIKPFWGFIIDRWGTMYRWAMVASVAVAVSVLAFLPTIETHSYAVILAVLIIPSFVRSFQDVAVDGLSLAVIKENQRGTVQTWMRVGAIIGTLLGGAVVFQLTKKVSWEVACIFVAMVTCVAGVLLPSILANKEVQEKRPQSGVTWEDLAGLNKQLLVILALLLAILATPAQKITDVAFIKWWSDKRYDKDLVMVIMSWIPLVWLAGAVLGGLLVKKVSRNHAMIIAILLVALSYCAVGIKSDWTQEFVVGLSWLTGVTDTIYVVTLMAFLMDLVDRRFAALSFALFMAGTNFCDVWGKWVGGVLIGEGMSVAKVFIISGVAQLLVIPCVIAIVIAKKKEKE